MKHEHILSYLQGVRKREKRERDFYDLLLFAGLSLELTQDLRELSEGLQDVSQYFNKSVYIHGPQASGKTVLAGHIFSETLKHSDFGNGSYELDMFNSGHPSYDKNYKGPEFRYERFCWYPGLIQQVKRTFNKDYEGPSEDALLDQVIDADLLVLDDIGAEYASEWSRNFMYVLIEERKVNLRPTIFTSNYSLEQLAEKYDSHKTPSRIVGMCKNRIINLVGKDRRISSP
jgi:DNA replication protein DnaC